MPRLNVPINDEDLEWLKQQAEANGSDSPALAARMLIRWARSSGMRASLSFDHSRASGAVTTIEDRTATPPLSWRDEPRFDPQVPQTEPSEAIDVDALVAGAVSQAEASGLTEPSPVAERPQTVALGPRRLGALVAVQGNRG